MRRRHFISGGIATLGVPWVAEAQRSNKVWRIGYLAPLSVQLDAPIKKAFEDGLREHGYAAGQSIDLAVRLALGKIEDLPRLAAELVGIEVDTIVAGGAAATAAAIGAARTIPVVFFAVIDPVTRGFVASLARPGKNVTGISFDVGALVSVKRLQLLKEIAPSIARVAVFAAVDVAEQPGAAELTVAAATLGLRLEHFAFRTTDELATTFITIQRQRPDALFVSPSSLAFQTQKKIADFAAEQRLPVMFPWREAAVAGALIAYGPDIIDSARRAAYFVGRILKGAKPADLPVEQPTKFAFAINLKTAKLLGIAVPPTLLARADEVIE